MQRADAWHSKGDASSLKHSIDDCTHSIELNADDPDAYRVRGAAFRATGQVDRANDDLAQLAALERKVKAPK